MPSTRRSPKRRRRLSRHSSGKVDKMGFLKGKSVRKQKKKHRSSVVRKLDFSPRVSRTR